jgi:hypothetical protein
MSGQFHIRVVFPPRKEAPLPIEGSRWAPEPIWVLRRREKFCGAGIRTRAVQPVAIPTPDT